MRHIITFLSGLTCLWCLLATPVAAQIIIIKPPHLPPIVPRPPVPPPRVTEYRIQAVEMQAQVRDQEAQIQISQVFENVGSQTIEASLYFPLPDTAAISGLTLLVDGQELPGKLLPKAEARRIYEETVRRQRDPALLEYIGQGLYQTSVFPIPARATRKVEIRYTQLLAKDGGLIDLSLPLGTNKFSSRPIDKLNVTVRIEATDAIKTIHSPSHSIEIERPDTNRAVCRLSLSNVSAPDDFRLLYGTQNGLVGMNVLSYRPNPAEEGYFLLLASPEVKSAMEAKVDKTVVLVVDKSGSMSGVKMEQAREALKFVVRQLRPSDTFNIVAYDSTVDSFRPELQRADEATVKAAVGYAESLFAGGGTNIDGALQSALKMLADKSRPSYVLFLTDGLPTVGETNEMNIARNAGLANAVGARVFTFGVGYDVNSRLLDRVSRDLRGQSVYVKPNENIESQVASLYNKIGSPLLTNLALSWEFDLARTADAPPAISRVYPKQLTDLFQGEQLVMVGRYQVNGTARIKLTGSVAGEQRRFEFPATLVSQSANENHGYVEKLWATRRIGEIIDELDLRGQNKELVDELVQLSMKHGILTPYTSFLADERTNLTARAENAGAASNNVEQQLRQNASGQSGFAQRAMKGRFQGAALGGGVPGLMAPPGSEAKADTQRRAGKAILFEDANGNTKVAENIQNIGQKTFYRRDNGWRDASVTPEQEKQAKRVKQFSPEYFELATRHGPHLAKYLAFTEPVLVNLGADTYQIDPAGDAGQ